MNRNYKIKTISVPERDKDDELTGIDITLEVVSMEKLKAIVSTPEGGTLTTEGLFLVCFENMPNAPKKLHVISAESGGQITIIKTEKYVKNNEFGHRNSARRGQSRKNRLDNHS